MTTNDKTTFLLRTLQSQHNALSKSLDDFIKAFPLGDHKSTRTQATILMGKLEIIKNSLDAKDFPEWVKPLENMLKWYIETKIIPPNIGLRIIPVISEIYLDIKSQQWEYLTLPEDSAINFSLIYNNCYQYSGVPELFDELVAHLEQIIGSDVIDSKRAIIAFEKLIATAKSNARGDYFSTFGLWHCAQVFFKNFSIVTLENTPVIKNFVIAANKTMEEIDVRMQEVQENIQKSLSESLNSDFPTLEYRAPTLLAFENDTQPVDLISNSDKTPELMDDIIDTVEPNSNN